MLRSQESWRAWLGLDRGLYTPIAAKRMTREIDLLSRGFGYCDAVIQSKDSRDGAHANDDAPAAVRSRLTGVVAIVY